MKYNLKHDIVWKLMNGIVYPTAIAQGWDVTDAPKVQRMLDKMVQKYNSLSKAERKVLIVMCEKHIDGLMKKIEDKEDAKKESTPS